MIITIPVDQPVEPMPWAGAISGSFLHVKRSRKKPKPPSAKRTANSIS
ncbi:MAG: hypothetical protein R3C26_21685 [Calditrichia bacterium]